MLRGFVTNPAVFTPTGSKAARPPAKEYSLWRRPGGPRLLGVYPTEAEARKAATSATEKGEYTVCRGRVFVEDPEQVVFRRRL